jgi:hypothetical protein
MPSRGGARDGDELKNLPPDGVQLPGVSRADIQATIDYAEQQAWIGKRPGWTTVSLGAGALALGYAPHAIPHDHDHQKNGTPGHTEPAEEVVQWHVGRKRSAKAPA